MARWAGWGAGPAGSGAAGPSRTFLAVVGAVALGIAITSAASGRWIAAAALACAAGYFGLRLFGGLGKGAP